MRLGFTRNLVDIQINLFHLIILFAISIIVIRCVDVIFNRKKFTWYDVAMWILNYAIIGTVLLLQKSL